VCLTAAAIDRDCLSVEYARATANAERISILASSEDDVLKLAFPVGDPIADLLHQDHTPFQPALGSVGPPTPASPPIGFPWQIPDLPAYGHGDYLPPATNALPPGAGALWTQPADFMRKTFLGEALTWPPV
jgi:hypothetical protein